MIRIIENVPNTDELHFSCLILNLLTYLLIGKNDAIKLQQPHSTIVPRPNQRLPHRSNINVSIVDAGNSVADATVKAMNVSNPIDSMFLTYPSKTSTIDI